MSGVSFPGNDSWFPSILPWKPVLDSQGAPKMGLLKLNDERDEIYGSFDKPEARARRVLALRAKFIVLTFVELPVGVLRVALRIVTLVTGDFARSGMELARNKWQLERQAWSLNPRGTAPSRRRFALLAVEQVLWQLAKYVAKIALSALAIIPLWFTALLGIFLNPNDAAYVFGKIENLCSRDQIPLPSGKWPSVRRVLLHVGDFLSPCMQTKAVLDQKNVYRAYPDHHPGTLRSQIRSLRMQLKEKQAFFDREFEGTPLKVKEVLALLEKVRVELRSREISEGDGTEADEAGDLRPRTAAQNRLARKLEMIQANLSKIEFERECFAQAVFHEDPDGKTAIAWALECAREELAAVIEGLKE